jgi:hypothetical protein
MCGYGIDDLIAGDFSGYMGEIFENFALFGLELYSPFCDNRLVNYVLDCTDHRDRKKLLSRVISSEDDDW